MPSACTCLICSVVLYPKNPHYQLRFFIVFFSFQQTSSSLQISFDDLITPRVSVFLRGKKGENHISLGMKLIKFSLLQLGTENSILHFYLSAKKRNLMIKKFENQLDFAEGVMSFSQRKSFSDFHFQNCFSPHLPCKYMFNPHLCFSLPHYF